MQRRVGALLVMSSMLCASGAELAKERGSIFMDFTHIESNMHGSYNIRQHLSMTPEEFNVAARSNWELPPLPSDVLQITEEVLADVGANDTNYSDMTLDDSLPVFSSSISISDSLLSSTYQGKWRKLLIAVCSFVNSPLSKKIETNIKKMFTADHIFVRPLLYRCYNIECKKLHNCNYNWCHGMHIQGEGGFLGTIYHAKKHVPKLSMAFEEESSSGRVTFKKKEALNIVQEYIEVVSRVYNKNHKVSSSFQFLAGILLAKVNYGFTLF